MSVESEILRIQHNIANTYAAVSEKGGEVPLQPTSANLAAAVSSIQTGVTQEELDTALATKQDTLTGQPGQVVGFNAQGAAQAVRGWSNPNLLDNWYFLDPVNQRGKTEYTAAEYTIDRWKNENASGTVTLNDGSVTFSWDRANSSEYAAFIQALDYKELVGKVFTWSLVASGTGLIYLAANDNSRVAITLTNEPKLYSITAQLETLSWLQDHAHFRIIADGNTSLTGEIKIFAVKLELGSIQTLAHQDVDGNWVLNDPPPNKALELAKCQRYFYYRVGAWCSGYFSGEKALIFIPLPSRMRATPSVSIGYANNVVDSNGGVYAVTEVLSALASPIGILVTLKTGRPSDSPISLVANADTQFILDANL